MLNPRFQAFLHNILCDEVVKGIFLCFMVHAWSGMIFVVTFCVFPCAANTESHKHDRLGKYVPSKTSTKVAPEVEVTVVPLAKEEDEALSSSPTLPAQGDVSNEQPKEAPTSSARSPRFYGRRRREGEGARRGGLEQAVRRSSRLVTRKLRKRSDCDILSLVTTEASRNIYSHISPSPREQPPTKLFSARLNQKKQKSKKSGAGGSRFHRAGESPKN